MSFAEKLLYELTMLQLDRPEFEFYIYRKKGLDKASFYRTTFNAAEVYFRDKEFTWENADLFFKYLEHKINPRTEKPLSRYALNNYIKAMKHLTKCLLSKSKISEDFMADWPLYSTEQPDVDILEKHEMRKFLEAAYGRCFRRAVCLETFLKTGCRPQEIFKATWDQLKSDELFVRETKTDRSRHAVILNDLMYKIKQLKKYPKHNFIFGSERGKIDGRWFNRFIRHCLVEAGIEKKIRSKELRHSYATLLASEGVSHFIIKEAMGHTTITTTQLYIHTTKEMLKEAAKKHSESYYVADTEEIKRETREYVDKMRRLNCVVSIEETAQFALIKVPIYAIV